MSIDVIFRGYLGLNFINLLEGKMMRMLFLILMLMIPISIFGQMEQPCCSKTEVTMKKVTIGHVDHGYIALKVAINEIIAAEELRKSTWCSQSQKSLDIIEETKEQEILTVKIRRKGFSNKFIYFGSLQNEFGSLSTRPINFKTDKRNNIKMIVSPLKRHKS